MISILRQIKDGSPIFDAILLFGRLTWGRISPGVSCIPSRAPIANQNRSAAFTCKVRGFAVLVTVPNAADVRLVFGLPQRTKLNGLNASTLKSSFVLSLIVKIRPAVRFSSLYQKPRTQLKLGLSCPKLNPVLVVNAAAFKYFDLDGSKSDGLVTR